MPGRACPIGPNLRHPGMPGLACPPGIVDSARQIATSRNGDHRFRLEADLLGLFRVGALGPAACAPRLEGRIPELPPGVRVYAFGDVHGRLDLLRELEGRALSEACGTARTRHIYLGDFVDRGPDSRGVIEHLLQPPPERIERVLLCGNHDRWFRDYLLTGQCEVDWLIHGGIETLASYGITMEPDAERACHPSVWRHVLEKVPPAHCRFLRDLGTLVEVGDYAFCHAGVRPGRPLATQLEADLYWIREPFLSHRGEFGKIIVHGHTVVRRPEQRTNRIGIDTGAVWTGVLTCAVLEGAEVRFISTG
jgi:serine/threonine protein phosphatase 1